MSTNQIESKEYFSRSLMQNWTLQAIECYSISSNCNKCSIKRGNYSFDCKMYKVVNQLLKQYGKPSLENIINY